MSAKKHPEVSEKNKKSEILDAYNELLEQVQGEKQMSLHDTRVQQEKIEMVKKAENLNEGKIAKNILDLKLNVIKELDSLTQKMDSEYRQLVDLQAAKEIESRNIKDLYGISQNADSLTALLLAQKNRKAQFEQEMEEARKQWELEMEETRNQWKLEKASFEQSIKEYKETEKRDREREEEEYSYTTKLQRKKDTDQYEARKQELDNALDETKARFEKEFAEREATIEAQEEEFKKLQEQVSTFPEQLEQAVSTTKESTLEQIETMYTHKTELATKEAESDLKLKSQTITALQAKIKEQEGFVKQLTHKADTSSNQVQEIALKAIEGSSSRTLFYGAQPDDSKKSQTGA